MSEDIQINMKDEDFTAIANDSNSYKSWFVEIISENNSKLARKILEKLTSNEVDSELDMLLRRLSTIVPYNMVIPYLRDQLGLSIQNDEECTKALNNIKSHLDTEEDKNMIDSIIRFVNSNEGELDDGVVPEVDLMMIIDKIPIENLTEVYNCVDYVSQVME